MSGLRKDPYLSLSMRRKPQAQAEQLKVETVAFAARHLADRSMDADVIILESADALTPFLDTMDQLSAAAHDSNPLYEATTLQAAMQHLEVKKVARVALIWSAADSNTPRQLIGVFPYCIRRFYLGMPVAIWSIWTHVHSFIATPLLRGGQENDAIRRFMKFADQSNAKLVRFPLFQSDGAFGPALTEVLGERGHDVVETGSHERAFLSTEMDGDTYLATHMRKKKRKEFNRLWNRLTETGDVKFEAPGNNIKINGWLKDFLALERSGWKGKRGTALAERPNECTFFESMCRDACARSKFHAAQITLDGRPIAMLASFVSGDGAYSFKIAHDERYARFSPGALLMMKAIGAFHDDARIHWVDSCAIPNHPMIDHIWAERRAMRELNAATSHFMSPWLVFYTTHMTQVADRVWRGLRQLYYRLRKEVERD